MSDLHLSSVQQDGLAHYHKAEMMSRYLYTMNDPRLPHKDHFIYIRKSDFQDILEELTGSWNEYEYRYIVLQNGYDESGDDLVLPESAGFGGAYDFYFEDPYDVQDGTYYTLTGRIMKFNENSSAFEYAGIYEIRYEKRSSGNRTYYSFYDWNIQPY